MLFRRLTQFVIACLFTTFAALVRISARAGLSSLAGLVLILSPCAPSQTGTHHTGICPHVSSTNLPDSHGCVPCMPI